MDSMSTQEAERRKSYEQLCPVATALDFVGDRWTLLILRELLGGPARFQELKDGLPGIAPNLLTERLRRLESDGIVRRMSAHGATVYAPTEDGAGIRTAIVELGKWASGVGRVGPATHERSIRALAVALQAVLEIGQAPLTEKRLVIELEVDGEYLDIVLDRSPTVRARIPSQPDARLSVSTEDISGLLSGLPLEPSVFTHLSGEDHAAARLTAAIRGKAYEHDDA